jgi:hypothetical protein
MYDNSVILLEKGINAVGLILSMKTCSNICSHVLKEVQQRLRYEPAKGYHSHKSAWCDESHSRREQLDKWVMRGAGITVEAHVGYSKNGLFIVATNVKGLFKSKSTPSSSSLRCEMSKDKERSDPSISCVRLLSLADLTHRNDDTRELEENRYIQEH